MIAINMRSGEPSDVANTHACKSIASENPSGHKP